MEANQELLFVNEPFAQQPNALEIEEPALVGPIELNILERVEVGFNLPEEQFFPSSNGKGDEEKGKFEGRKEVVLVSGWVDARSVYNDYLLGFLFRVAIGISILLSLRMTNQVFWPVGVVSVSIFAIKVLLNLGNLVRSRNDHIRLKIFYTVELQLNLSYLVFYTGFLLVLLEIIRSVYLTLFTLPLVAMGIFMFIIETKEHMFLAQKKFMIFEVAQILLICVKLSAAPSINWNYALLFCMAAGIYLTVLGLLMAIMISCSMFGFLFTEIESWKFRSLIWMTWFYLWTGLTVIYLCKSVVMFFNDDDSDSALPTNYFHFRSQTTQMMVYTAYLMIFSSAGGLFLHLLWKKEIISCFEKVLYKNELRKEVVLRFFSESFTFKLIQNSATYFSRTEKDKDLESQTNESAQTQVPADPSDPCVVCFEKEPEIMFDPCSHGGVCKTCAVQFIRNHQGSCLFCKQKIQKMFLIAYDKKEKCFKATAELALSH